MTKNNKKDCPALSTVCAIKENSKINLLGENFSRDIRPFIDAIDSLRQFGVDQDVDLPRVVVVGDQSSGKSSIIEAISGVELPRGSGIVTRCPLELQLMRVPPGQAWTANVSYGLNHKVNVDSPTLVDASIREAQNEICGSYKGISDRLITLRIESPAENAPDLTLIDLPGIARTAVEGQPEDICESIKEIIKTYIVRENTVILCVVSANLDAAVNESISLARQYDPEMNRTFGVITKPDLAEEHLKDGVLCLLNNEKIPLSKGYLMVKCRSQKDLDNRISLEESLKNENDFFKHDAIYKDANSTKLGTGNLAIKITKELVNVIGVTLGSIMGEIEEKLNTAKTELMGLPKEIPSKARDKYIFLHSMVSELNDAIKMALTKGRGPGNAGNLFVEWRPVFENFRNLLFGKFQDAFERKWTMSKLIDQMDKRRGEEISGFLNFDFFKDLILKEIKMFEPLALEVPSKISTLTEIRLKEIIKNQCLNVSIIQKSFKRIISDTMKKQMTEVTKRIQTIFREEQLVFTMDATFEEQLEMMDTQEEAESPQPLQHAQNYSQKQKMKTSQSFPEYTINSKQEKIKEIQHRNAQEMRSLLKCYFNIVSRRLADQIPMVTRNYLHMDLYDLLKEQFLCYATEVKDNITEIVREDTAMEEKRKTLDDQIMRLQRSIDKLDDLNIQEDVQIEENDKDEEYKEDMYEEDDSEEDDSD